MDIKRPGKPGKTLEQILEEIAKENKVPQKSKFTLIQGEKGRDAKPKK